MNQKQSDYTLQLCALILILFSSIYLSACNGRSVAKSQDESKAQPLSYQVLKDEMGFTISIGVESEITEQQLRVTLAKAADDHQNDAARDYLMMDHLWVDAYLIAGEHQSTIPAGRLSRYVPPRNPNIKDEDPSTEREDKFTITLEEAKKTLQ
jgi:hypothetical protein